MSARASTSPAPLPVVPLDTWSVGQRLVHRSAAAVPQATVGSGGNHPRCRPPSPGAHSPPAGPTARDLFDPRFPGPPRQSSEGVTQTKRSATHPVHLWLSGPASAVEAGVRGVAGMARFSAAGPTGLRRDHCRDRPWQVVIARTGRQTVQRSIPKRPARPTLRTKSHPTCSRCGVIELRGYVGVSSGQATVGTGLP